MVKEESQLLTPAEVALLFRVDPKTVARWAAVGRLPSIRTPGGHRRFPRPAVEELLKSSQNSPDEIPSATTQPS